MSKFFNKWLRKIHRWIAVPTAIMIPVAVVVKFSGNPQWQQGLKQFESAQSLLMLGLAITGTYLYLLPIVVKKKRKVSAKVEQARQGT